MGGAHSYLFHICTQIPGVNFLTNGWNAQPVSTHKYLTVGLINFKDKNFEDFVDTY